MRKQIFLLLASVMFAFVSCGPDTFCVPDLINPVLIGFSTSDIDTLILRRYKPNDNYRTLIDTLLIVNPATNNGFSDGIYSTSNDTTIVCINEGPPYEPISYGHDWIVYIPAKNKTIFISNIVSNQNEEKKGCSAPIASFVQDSQLISAPTFFSTNEFYTTGYRAYIHP
jgi:hypothetical protein